jgi:hypothetical protein
MLKDLYQSKKIVVGLSMNYEKIDVCDIFAYSSRSSTRMTPNVCIVVGRDTLRWQIKMEFLLSQLW